MVGLPDGEKNFEDMYNCLDTIPACDRQTDRRTNGQTSYHSIVRAMHTRRAVTCMYQISKSDLDMTCRINDCV